MGKYDQHISVRLTREERAQYDRLLRFYNAVSSSPSKAFKLLLRRLVKDMEEQAMKVYAINRDFDPPVIEHGPHTTSIASEEEFLERDNQDTWTE